jgi:hypothetical protein
MARRLGLLMLVCGCAGYVSEPMEPMVQPTGEAPRADSGTAQGQPDAATLEPAADAGPTAAAVDSGTGDAGAPDSGTPTVDAGQARVPLFIAQGKLGRTTVSCDDGKTWIADRSEVPAGRCWDNTAGANNIECDHNLWSSTGLVEAGGYVFATYGWGYPGVLRRTADGIQWEDVLPGHTFAGLAAGNGRVMANERTPYTSTADGAAGSWTAQGDVGSAQWNVRQVGFVPAAGQAPGRFVISLESSAGDVVFSDDDGAHWTRATTLPSTCGRQVSSIRAANGLVLLFQNDGSICRSADRGVTWTWQKVADGFSSPGMVAGGELWVWNGATRWRSTDALTWVSEAGTPADITIGPVARAANGTLVSVRGGWDVWYAKQRFYRSTDGLHWEVLPLSAFVQGHPITALIATTALPSVQCPAR